MFAVKDDKLKYVICKTELNYFFYILSDTEYISLKTK